MKRKHRITIRIDDELLEDLKFISFLEGESITFIIRTVLKDYLNYYMFKTKPKQDEEGNI